MMRSEGAYVRPSGRRRFLREMAITGIGGAVTLAVAVPLIGYFFEAVTKRLPEEWVRLCALDEVVDAEPKEFRVAFQPEDRAAGYRIITGVFVIRRGEEILAFSNTCTHMGCSVRWLAWRQQILCPCHGGMYDRWGQLMGGPPAADLPLLPTRVQGSDLYVANRIVRRGVST
ncbi:MAG: ubiquinol-cytochrome c reductase iron-sulfur subunit [Chloroflexi bacterium]|nr:ubiquinol-cytochrome c reductase iron-sulfur subunit [Chloroflexota bacterium]MCL5107507.1 ubiquinol-cytochrome c reductase iron-sulfur subunit [Chloroflexota bacterium]